MVLVLFLMLLSAMTRTENKMTLLRSWERLHLWQESVSGITHLVPMLKKVTREESAMWLLLVDAAETGRELSWRL